MIEAGFVNRLHSLNSGFRGRPASASNRSYAWEGFVTALNRRDVMTDM